MWNETPVTKKTQVIIVIVKLVLPADTLLFMGSLIKYADRGCDILKRYVQV